MGRRPVRKASARLSSWDYSSAGRYFLTFRTAHGRCTLGRVEHNPARVVLSRAGRAVDEAIALPHPGFAVEKHVVMPNHVHLLVAADGTGGEVGRLVARVKRAAGAGFWQRGYYDHVIRSDADWRRVWGYIDTNPDKWGEDEYFVDPATGWAGDFA